MSDKPFSLMAYTTLPAGEPLLTIPPTLTRAGLVDKVKHAIALSRNDASDLVSQVLECMGDALSAGEDVSIQNFGTFKLLDKPERTGRIFTTMREVTIPPRRVVTFWPCQKLRIRTAAE